MSELTEADEALAGLVDYIKTYKVAILHGMSKREVAMLMDELHKANLALNRRINALAPKP